MQNYPSESRCGTYVWFLAAWEFRRLCKMTKSRDNSLRIGCDCKSRHNNTTCPISVRNNRLADRCNILVAGTRNTTRPGRCCRRTRSRSRSRTLAPRWRRLPPWPSSSGRNAPSSSVESQTVAIIDDRWVIRLSSDHIKRYIIIFIIIFLNLFEF